MGDEQEIHKEVHELASFNEAEKLRALLDERPELIDAPGSFARTPLHSAAEAGAVACVRLLIERKADVNSSRNLHSWTPLFEAVRSTIYGATLEESLECARLLLEHGADPNAVDSHRQETPIFNVNSLEMLLLLEKYGADLDVVSNEDQYPYESHALYVGDPALLNFWLKRGVDVNHQPGFGEPLLNSVVSKLGAEERGEKEVEQVSILLKHGANPNVGDNLDGDAPLHTAVSYGRVDIARLLLDGGADPNFQNHENQTPLHQAVEKESVELVQLLIERGADVNLRDMSKRSAWEMVQDSPGLRPLLEPFGRDIPQVQFTPDQLIERLSAIPGFSRAVWEPCSEAEIELLEGSFNVILPESYKKFLRLMGQGAGGFLETDHWEAFYFDLLEIARRDDYRDYCEDLPDDYFVFASRLGGIFLFFIADGYDDDPPVYSFGDEHEGTYRKSYDSFWGFFEAMVEYYEFYSKKRLV